MWLALDTSTAFLSLALLERVGDAWHVVDQALHGPPKKHSELLPGALETLLAQRGCRPRELEGMVVGLGPGSFTGLRVGIACAKGWAYAAQRPLGGASSLAAVAAEGPEDRLLFPVALSRRGELYVGTYRRTGLRVEALAPERALSLEAFAAELVEESRGLAFGPALADHRAALTALGVPAARLQDGPAFPSAARLPAMAILSDTHDFQRIAALEPHYIGASGAERHATKEL